MQTAHVGLVVADGPQRSGVGSALLRALLARAAARGAKVVVMDVLPANRRVLAMIGRRWPGARYEFAPDSVTVRALLSLAGRARDSGSGRARGGLRASPRARPRAGPRSPVRRSSTLE